MKLKVPPLTREQRVAIDLICRHGRRAWITEGKARLTGGEVFLRLSLARELENCGLVHLREQWDGRRYVVTVGDTPLVHPPSRRTLRRELGKA